MKTSFPWKQALALFAAVLLGYLAAFYGLEHARHRKGPWKVDFVTDSTGQPSLNIYQDHLKISTRLEFRDEKVLRSDLLERVIFDRPKKQPIPFGKVIYEDLTFLPGVVTFDLFGHEVELLPRVLIVNKRELEWKVAGVQLWSTNKPATPPKPAKGYD